MDPRLFSFVLALIGLQSFKESPWAKGVPTTQPWPKAGNTNWGCLGELGESCRGNRLSLAWPGLALALGLTRLSCGGAAAEVPR